MTIIDNVVTELDITVHYHCTHERDFSLTVDDKFHSFSVSLEIHRVGEPSLTSPISHDSGANKNGLGTSVELFAATLKKY